MQIEKQIINENLHLVAAIAEKNEELKRKIEEVPGVVIVRITDPSENMLVPCVSVDQFVDEMCEFATAYTYSFKGSLATMRPVRGAITPTEFYHQLQNINLVELEAVARQMWKEKVVPAIAEMKNSKVDVTNFDNFLVHSHRRSH